MAVVAEAERLRTPSVAFPPAFAAGKIGVRGSKELVPAEVAASIPNGGHVGFPAATPPGVAGRASWKWLSAGLRRNLIHVARRISIVPKALCGYQVTSPVCSVLLLRTICRREGNDLPGSGPGPEAIFNCQALQVGIRLLDAEARRDLTGIAADGP